MPPLDLETLLAAVRSGELHDFLLFYGHTARPDGVPSNACFSQWFAAPFEVDGQRYPTAEHWMMASKARLFGDAVALERILAAPSPASAKKLGRQVRGFDEAKWGQARFAAVSFGSVAKFSSAPALRELLLRTGESILVEASPTDRIWGIGLGAEHPAAKDAARWRGLNLLGFALVRARGILRGQLPAVARGGW